VNRPVGNAGGSSSSANVVDTRWKSLDVPRSLRSRSYSSTATGRPATCSYADVDGGSTTGIRAAS
jgi:hypothetical protein